VGTLFLRNLPLLTDLQGLENATITSVGIHEMERLVTTRGLNTDGFSGYLGLVSNRALTSLEAFAGVTSMEHVTIFDCASLENLHGLEELTSANSLQILGNASLESLRALSGVTAIDLDLSIYGNPSLPTCPSPF
jgi:hypothetical protein